MNFAKKVTMWRALRATRRANQPRERRWVSIWMNSVAGKVELVGVTAARGQQPHSIVTQNIVTHKGSAVTEATNLAQSPLFFSNQN